MPVANTRADPVVTTTAYLRVLQARLSALTDESAEAILDKPVQDLVEALGRNAGRDVLLRGQPHRAEGIPDFSIKDGRLLIGHVETKAVGKGAEVRRYTGHDRRQWESFQRLPNVLYTDGVSFALYRSGERVGDVLTLDFSEDDQGQSADPSQARKLAALISELCS